MDQLSGGFHSTFAPGSTSLSLIERVRANDPDAWRKLTELYGPLIYRWCRERRLQAEDAADIVQNVFRAFVTGIHGFRRETEQDSFRGWLWTLTRNKIRDHFRNRAQLPQAAGGTDAHALLEALAAEESAPSVLPGADSPGAESPPRVLLQRALEIARREVDPRTWDAFYRLAVEGHSAAEIATDCGLTANAVRQAKFRVMRKLRELLEDELPA